MTRRDDPQLTVILDRFDEAWAGGDTPEIRDFLPDKADDSALKSVLTALVMIDIERRWRGTSEAVTIPPDAGQLPAKPTLEDYVAQYPELGTIESLPVELISEEYRVRYALNDRPGHEEYLRRFSAQAIELQSALANVDSDPSIDATITLPQPKAAAEETLPPEASGTRVDPSAGDRVRYFGEYELLDEIARGGMGVVFKARQVKLNRIVALKMILSGELAGEEEVQRFKTEAEAAANLDHPGIVPIYEIGEHQGQHYFSMGFVEGQSLADRVKDGPLPPREAVEIVKKVAEAVAYAHEKGVIHRDLKPANVLLDASSEPRVTDFGLAKQVESDSDLTRTGTVMGTPSYMSPEQACGNLSESGPASDVYSLGAMLFCLLTGRPPFQSANVVDVLLQVRESEPVSPRVLNPATHPDLETLCLKCLDKVPSRRYRTALDLAADLQRFQRGEPIVARPVGKTERAWRWCKRNPVIAYLATGLVLVLVIGLVTSTVLGLYAQAHREAAENRAAELEVALETNRRQAHVESVRLYAAQIAAGHFRNTREDLRGWEYHYLRTLSLHKQPTGRHEARLFQVAYSSDGRRIASGSADGVLKVWDASTAEELLQIEAYADAVRYVAYSADGTRIVSCSDKGSLKVWNAGTGQKAFSLEEAEHITGPAMIIPGGRYLIAVDQDSFCSWDALTGQRTRTVSSKAVGPGFCFSPDGKRFVSGDGEALKVWDTATGENVLTLSGHDDAPHCAAFSWDGKRIASGADDGLKLWDAETGREILSARDTYGVMCVAFSPDRGRIVSGNRIGQVRLWAAVSGVSDPIRTFNEHADGVACVAFSPNGQQVVSGSADKSLKTWDTIDGEASPTISVGNVLFRPPEDIAISGDGRKIAIGFGNAVKVLDAMTGRETLNLVVHRPTGHYRGIAVAFSPDGKYVAGAGGYKDHAALKVWDAENGEEALALTRQTQWEGGITCVTYSPDGRRLVTGHAEPNTITVWDARTGREIITIEGHAGHVNCVTYSPDGQRIISGDGDYRRRDPSVKVWDAATGNEVLTLRGHKNSIDSLAVSSDGRRIVSAAGDEFRIWDARTGEELLAVATDPLHSITSIGYSPDGRRIATGSYDNKVKIWDTETGVETFSLVINPGPPGGNGAVVVWSPMGERVVAASGDGIKIWYGAASAQDDSSLD